MRVIVTGGYGFIGSAVVRQLARAGHSVWNVDKQTYAANPDALEGAAATNVHACITDREAMAAVFTAAQPDALIHLAAETHVDRSIDGPAAFIKTNIEGSFSLLEAALAWWNGAGKPADFRFVHVSTDEVFGDLGVDDPAFTAHSPYRPSSPYSASKAASDHLARAWHRTYGLPLVVTNCSNNYGPWQNSEKLIPTVIRKALSGARIPIYGRGENIRDWLYVEDHASGLIAAIGADAGSTLLFGGKAERSNLDLVRAICRQLDQLRPTDHAYEDQIEFVTDRPGHDRRYGVDPASAKTALGWTAEHTLEQGLAATVNWYLQTMPVGDMSVDDRLGLGRSVETE